MMDFSRRITSFGTFGIAAEDGGLTRLWLPNNEMPELPESQSLIIEDAFRQLEEYFSGARREFSLPFTLRGTLFSLSVWDGLMQIPYGHTISYGELARRVGSPRAARAVGMANHYNPLPIFVPCHRVVAAGGGLGGYGGGLELKERLLSLENSVFEV